MSDYPKKTCVFCKHWDIDPGWGGTDVTAGESASITCYKQHYAYESVPGDGDSFRTFISQAEACPDYEQVQP